MYAGALHAWPSPTALNSPSCAMRHISCRGHLLACLRVLLPARLRHLGHSCFWVEYRRLYFTRLLAASGPPVMTAVGASS